MACSKLVLCEKQIRDKQEDYRIILKIVYGKVFAREFWAVCHLSGDKTPSLLTLVPKKIWILNPYTFMTRPHSRYDLPSTIGFIVEYYNSDFKKIVINQKNPIWIIPKLFNSEMLSRYIAKKILATRLPPEIVDHIITFLKVPSIGTKTQYLTKIGDTSLFLSDNLLKLYSIKSLLDYIDRDIMNIGIENCEAYHYNISAMSIGSFNHIFSNGDISSVKKVYKTIDIMIKERKMYLDAIKKYDDK